MPSAALTGGYSFFFFFFAQRRMLQMGKLRQCALSPGPHRQGWDSPPGSLAPVLELSALTLTSLNVPSSN